MLKKLMILVIILVSVHSFSACGRDISADGFMREFAAVYPLEGTVYTSLAEFGEEGYMDDELFRRIYAYRGDMPEEFAIYLNKRPERGEECGIFKADGVGTEAIAEFCIRRIKLLSEKNTEGMLLTSGEYVFYSTLSDSERAKELFYRLIK